MFFNEEIRKARYFAIEIHGSQKYDNTFPYIKHLEDVFLVLQRFGIKDVNLLIAAFLHDAIEDGAASYNKINRKFNKDVAELVYSVSDELGRNRKEKHKKTFPKIKGDFRKIILKLSDRIANIEFGINDNTEKSMFDMYKKEYPEFRKELRCFDLPDEDGFKMKMDQMWYYLDSIFLPKE